MGKTLYNGGERRLKAKLFILYLVFLMLFSFNLYSYNAPVGGQTYFNMSSPTQFTSAGSCAGGGLFMPGVGSIFFNPALPGFEQRIQLDLGFSALISTDKDDRPFNAAFQTGIMIPTKFFVISGVIDGLFLNSDSICLDNSLNLRGGLSKEVNEHLIVGANINVGVLWGGKTDWSLGADLGGMYRWTDLGKLKDLRLGISLMNLGKYFNHNDALGIDDRYSADFFPTPLTVKVGIASTCIDVKNFKAGFSFDLSTPLFQDLLIDVGIQMAIKDMFYIGLAENIDIQELRNERYNCLPSISFGVKFKFTAKGSKYLREHEWDNNEMLTSLSWQQKYQEIQAVSAGAIIYVGQLDTKAPEIQLWNGEDD